MSEYKDYKWFKDTEMCVHKYLYPDLLKMLNKSKNKCILDIGCGNGYIARELIQEGFNVYGIDASRPGIEIAAKFYPDRFFIQNIESNQLPAKISEIKFDTIISTEVLEHLYNPRGFIKFSKNILLSASGGELIISTPYHGYLKNVILSLTGKMDKHFTALWDGGHIKFWSRKTLTKLLEEHGLNVIEFKGSGRIPLIWKSMLIKARI
jgi:2-polyprenyl-3-methyl-5-hydroxy-6-metoxy-1,4-benzoquinol methylase